MKSDIFKHTISGKNFFIKSGAFGSGEHETTSGCIGMLELIDVKGKSVLDIGCGTGILSVAAFMNGAKSVIGFDISFDACKSTEENFEMNNVSDGSVVCCYSDAIAGKFDVIFANIYVDVILHLVSFIDDSIKNGGFLILSGIPAEEHWTVKSRFEKDGFVVIKSIYHEDFVTILMKKGR